MTLSAEQIKRLIFNRTGVSYSMIEDHNFDSLSWAVCALQTKSSVVTRLLQFFSSEPTPGTTIRLQCYEFAQLEGRVFEPWESFERNHRKFFHRVYELAEGSLPSGKVGEYRSLIYPGRTIICHPCQSVSIYRAAWYILDLFDKRPVDPEIFALHL